jgi:membrane protease YdiL (CAAX protease family)
MTRLIRTHPLPAFVVLACLVGWLPYLLAAAGVGSEPENLPLGPLVAAAIVAACCGRDTLAAWGRRVRDVRLPLLWLAVALLLPVAMHILQVLINYGFGAPLPTSAQLAGWTSVPVGFVVMLILVGVGEEAGWTAFATPLLLQKYSFGTTFAVMAAIRIGWHLPLMLTGNLPWVLGTLGNAGFQLVLLCLYRFSGDRWFTAAVAHASLNALGGPFLFQMVTGADRARLAVIMAVAYALLGLALAALLARRTGSLGAPPSGRTRSPRRATATVPAS